MKILKFFTTEKGMGIIEILLLFFLGYYVQHTPAVKLIFCIILISYAFYKKIWPIIKSYAQ